MFLQIEGSTRFLNQGYLTRADEVLPSIPLDTCESKMYILAALETNLFCLQEKPDMLDYVPRRYVASTCRVGVPQRKRGPF